MGGKVSDTSGYPQEEPDVRKCTLIPVEDLSGVILSILFAEGGAMGPEDGDRQSGLRYFRLPRRWTLERTDHSYHGWCRLGPVDLVALTGTYLILDDRGRQRAKVYYQRNASPASSSGLLARAPRYTFRDTLNEVGDRLIIEVMDGVTAIHHSEQIPVLNGRPDSRIYDIERERIETWLRSQVGDYPYITAEYYDD